MNKVLKKEQIKEMIRHINELMASAGRGTSPEYKNMKYGQAAEVVRYLGQFMDQVIEYYPEDTGMYKCFDMLLSMYPEKQNVGEEHAEESRDKEYLNDRD